MRLDKCTMRDFVEDLSAAFKQAEQEAGIYLRWTKKITLLERAINKPAKSFYVSMEEGTRMIHQIEKKGISEVKDSPLTNQKYNDLYREYLRLKERFTELPDLAVIRMAIEQPAPRFYVRPQTAGLILNKALRK